MWTSVLGSSSLPADTPPDQGNRSDSCPGTRHRSPVVDTAWTQALVTAFTRPGRGTRKPRQGQRFAAFQMTFFDAAGSVSGLGTSYVDNLGAGESHMIEWITTDACVDVTEVEIRAT